MSKRSRKSERFKRKPNAPVDKQSARASASRSEETATAPKKQDASQKELEGKGKPKGPKPGSEKPAVLDFRKPGNKPAQSSDRNPRTYELTEPVFFVGFMGAGKTSVSRKLARMCKLISIDMDTYIERQEDCTVSEIFEKHGESGFRTIETQVLRQLSEGSPALIGCGGGVVTIAENREILKAGGCVVFLRVSAAEAKGRISDLSTRPLFNELEEAERRNQERLPFYLEVADIEIDTSGKNVYAIACEVRRALQKRGILCVR